MEEDPLLNVAALSYSTCRTPVSAGTVLPFQGPLYNDKATPEEPKALLAFQAKMRREADVAKASWHLPAAVPPRVPRALREQAVVWDEPRGDVSMC